MSSRKDLPLGYYLGMTAVFNLLLGRLVLRRGAGRARLSNQDMVLAGIAAHKLSRIVTKDVVTSPLRVPFTRFQEFLGYGEVQEEAREDAGRLRMVIGEMLSCNYCADPWLLLGLLYMHDRFPDRARFVMRFFSSVALADFLHVAYESTRTRSNVLTLREERLERQEHKAA